jgi:hypothetical protein
VLAGVRRLRRQWGLTDYVLIGAGIGAGFQLVEGLLRYGQNTARAIPNPRGGWDVAVGLGGSQHVPGLGEIIGGWLPAPVSSVDLFGVSAVGSNTLAVHLVWTAIAGFGVGLMVRARGWRKLVGLLPLVYVSADHAAYNFQVTGLKSDLDWLVTGLADLRVLMWLYPLLVLLLAIALDFVVLSRGRATGADVLLHGERQGRTGLSVLSSFAGVSPRFTLPIAMRFGYARRALWYTQERRPEALATAVRATRDQMDAAWDPRGWHMARMSVPPWRVRIAKVLRNWQFYLWLLILLPGVLYLVVGTFKPFAGLQAFLASDSVFPVVLGIAGVGLLWLVWQLVRTVRSVPGGVRREYGDPVARSGFRVLAGLGSVAAGVAAGISWLDGTAADRRMLANVHILDALSRALLILAIAVFIFGCIYYPPLGLAVLTTGQTVLVPTAAAGTFATITGVTTVLGGLSVLMAQASGNGGGDPGGQTARQRRLDELSKDPAHGNRISPKSQQEARVGLELEEAGKVPPIRRDPTGGADFIDDTGQYWDVKGFNSNYPPNQGGYTLRDSLNKIRESLSTGENVMLDTSQMRTPHIDQLRAAVESTPEWAGKILWWP